MREVSYFEKVGNKDANTLALGQVTNRSRGVMQDGNECSCRFLQPEDCRMVSYTPNIAAKAVVVFKDRLALCMLAQYRPQLTKDEGLEMRKMESSREHRRARQDSEEKIVKRVGGASRVEQARRERAHRHAMV